MNLTIILPAFNEESVIISTLDAQLRWHPPDGFTLKEVLVVDDGSLDGTRNMVESYAIKHSLVRLISHPHNRGKGAALATGVLSATGDIVGCVDADLAYPPSTYTGFLTSFLDESIDIAIGNRYLSEQHSNTLTMTRKFASRSFRLLVRALGLTPFGDTQCGIKFFKLKSAVFLFRHMESTGFLYDLDLLSLAVSVGMSVRDVPVIADYGPNSTIRVHRQLFPVAIALFRVVWSRRNHQSNERLRLQWKEHNPVRLEKNPDFTRPPRL